MDQDQKEEPSTDQGWLTDAANKIDPLTDIDQGKLDVNDFKVRKIRLLPIFVLFFELPY